MIKNRFIYDLRYNLSMCLKIKKFLDNLKDENIHFKKHFYDRAKDRPISEQLIRTNLRKTNKLLNVEELQSKRERERKYKLWIKLSNKYSLVIVSVVSEKDLYIITAWNTDRKWQKQIQK